ncbi:MAG: hypothetical protein HFI70_00265 [Lachnospiraceae bacterium]|nr:hypothetical protein [Lachnospiraceae bacterium]
MTEKKYGLNGCALKCIAMASMLIDHIGAVLFPQYLILRMIGRLAFPIYCFLLVEGVVHTKDIRKYESRLLIFAVISEIPFDLAFYGRIQWENQNIFFTLFLGVTAIDLMRDNANKLNKYLILILTVIAAEILHTDYGGAGIVFIVCYYLLYQRKLLKQVMFLLENLVLYGIGIQSYASFAVFPMLLYNGRKGPSLKYFFYIFYPVHLLILYLIILTKYGK